MKVGDLVHDASFGINGIIVDVDIRRIASDKTSFRKWTILYEDGQSDEAFDNELEVISESR